MRKVIYRLDCRLCQDGEESHWESTQSLSQWLRYGSIWGLSIIRWENLDINRMIVTRLGIIMWHNLSLIKLRLQSRRQLTFLRKAGVPGLAGIDVRQLTKKIREQGTMKAKVAEDI